MTCITDLNQLPMLAQRILRRYENKIRARAILRLSERLTNEGREDNIRLEDIGYSIAAALDEVAKGKPTAPLPDERIMRRAMAEFHAGNFMTTEQFIAELQSSGVA